MPIHYIKIPLPSKLKTIISNSVLDWAEKKPKSQDGYIHSLQRMREHSRKESQSVFDKSRPPQGGGLKFLGLRMFEVFYYEDFDGLLTSLKRMFQNIDNNYGDDPLNNFTELSNSLVGGWKRYIGWIYRDRKPLGPTNCLLLPNLPSEVDHICQAPNLYTNDK